MNQQKNSLLKEKIIGWGTVIFIIMFFLFFLFDIWTNDEEQTPPISKEQPVIFKKNIVGDGDETTIKAYDNTGVAYLFLTKETFSAWSEAVVERNQLVANQLLASGKILEIPDGTRIKLLIMQAIDGESMYRIRILEGKYKGQEGYIYSNSFVSEKK